MFTPELAECRRQAPKSENSGLFRSLEEIVAHCAREALACPPLPRKSARDPRNDGTLYTWAGGDKWLWKVAHELHEYDLRERDIPGRRRGARAFAKSIIEGRARWPDELLPWKRISEHTYYRDCKRVLPPWLDERNLTPPQRVRASERIAEIKADIAHERRVARIWS